MKATTPLPSTRSLPLLLGAVLVLFFLLGIGLAAGWGGDTPPVERLGTESSHSKAPGGELAEAPLVPVPMPTRGFDPSSTERGDYRGIKAPPVLPAALDVATSAAHLRDAPAGVVWMDGHVQDEQGRPLAGVAIDVLGRDSEGFLRLELGRTVSDASGRFAWNGAPNIARVFLRPTLRGFVARDDVGVAVGERAVPVVMERATSVTGRVRVDEGLVRNVVVWVTGLGPRHKKEVTRGGWIVRNLSPRGEFELTDLPASVTRGFVGFHPSEPPLREFDIGTSFGSVDIDLRGQFRRAQVRVEDQLGRPVPQAWIGVRGHESPGDVGRQLWTDTTGCVELLLGAKPLDLEVRAAQFGVAKVPGVFADVAVALPAPLPVTLDVGELPLLPPERFLWAYVTRVPEERAAGARGPDQASAWIGPSGRATVGIPEPGRYRVTLGLDTINAPYTGIS